MKNKTTYTRKVKSTKWAGFYDHQTVTRNAHNRKRSHVRIAKGSPYTGVLLGTSLWITTFLAGISTGFVIGETYPQLISSASAQEVVHTPQALPEPILEHSEGLVATLDTPAVSVAGQASPSASKSEKQQILEYIVEVFGDDADRAIWVAKCESGLRANALNDKNRNGSVDYGVFQINSVHIRNRGDGFTRDWRENVKVAKQIFDEQGFTPWVCAKSVGEKNYLGQ